MLLFFVGAVVISMYISAYRVQDDGLVVFEVTLQINIDGGDLLSEAVWSFMATLLSGLSMGV